jgi:pilus assembly protein CpaE
MVSYTQRGLEVIKVIIASDIPRYVEEINILLEQAYIPIEVIATVETKQCLQMAAEFGPDIVLFIDEEADVPATEVSKDIYQSLPGTATIILARPTKQEDTNYLRQALLAGAKDVLPLPPLLDQLIVSLQQAHQLESGRRVRRPGRAYRPEREAGGQLIVVYSAKGGGGRSVFAANLGVFVAKMNPQLRTALFDLDLQFGDQQVLLNLEPTRSVLDLLPVIDELTPDAVASAMTIHPSGLQVLLAPPDPSQATLIDGGSVRKILIALRAYYDVTFIDPPLALSEITLTALEIADVILQICSLDILSIRRTRSCLEIYERLGISRESVRFVLNRVHKRDEIKPDEFKMLFGPEVIEEIPADYFFLQPYVNTGVPLADALEPSPIVESFKRLAKQLIPASQ